MRLSRICAAIGISIVLLYACKQEKEKPVLTNNSERDSIRIFAQSRPGGEAFDFHMPVDPALDSLEITDQNKAILDDNELVIGIIVGNTPIAVPIKVLSGFEVANLRTSSENYLLTWCPLVGSAQIFDGNIGGDTLGFDFGRGLIDNNLLLVDRRTKTVWNQLSNEAVQGELKGEKLSLYPTIQSTWKFWKDKYPNTKVAISTDTSNAVFPQFVLQKQYYNTWIPGNKYPNNTNHEITNLGIGAVLSEVPVFIPLEELFKKSSPMTYQIKNQAYYVHFNEPGITAWIEDKNGKLVPSTMVYNWAWNNFYPNSQGINQPSSD